MSPEMWQRRDRVVLHVDHLRFETSPVGLARLLGPWNGIDSVVVDSDAGLVIVEYDASRWSADTLRQAVATCGYACADASSEARTIG